MAFTPPDLLASVIAAYTSGLTAAYGLTIQNGGTRVRVATGCLRTCSRNLSWICRQTPLRRQNQK
jgi:hypothetical protein